MEWNWYSNAQIGHERMNMSGMAVALPQTQQNGQGYVMRSGMFPSQPAMTGQMHSLQLTAATTIWSSQCEKVETFNGGSTDACIEQQVLFLRPWNKSVVWPISSSPLHASERIWNRLQRILSRQAHCGILG